MGKLKTAVNETHFAIDDLRRCRTEATADKLAAELVTFGEVVSKRLDGVFSVIDEMKNLSRLSEKKGLAVEVATELDKALNAFGEIEKALKVLPQLPEFLFTDRQERRDASPIGRAIVEHVKK